MRQSVKNNVHWVGKVDWELRKFHGNEYSTHKGSSYNSYLIQETKNCLIDTVWAPYAKEFVDNLAQEIELTALDYIVINHGEIDHSGALPELMRRVPHLPIYCTANAVKSLTGHYHQNWNFQVVKSGDRLDLGNGKELIFIEAPMLHWPDTMFCYLTKDNILFSNDAFGQHYASEHLFNDLVSQSELFDEALKYYANILAPFSKLVAKKISELLALGLPIDTICTSHGIIWRHQAEQIIQKYLAWSQGYQENQILIIYDTMWQGTRILADSLAKSIHQADPTITVKVVNASNTDKNDIVTEAFKSKAILVGSPTINNGISTAIAGLLEELQGLKLSNKVAAAFGCYGWSGEGNRIITERLKLAGFTLLNEGLRVAWNPDALALQKCLNYGSEFVSALKG